MKETGQRRRTILKRRTIVILGIACLLLAVFLGLQAFRQQMIYEDPRMQMMARAGAALGYTDVLDGTLWTRNLFALLALVVALVPVFAIWRNKRLMSDSSQGVVPAFNLARLEKHKKVLAAAVAAVFAGVFIFWKVGAVFERQRLINEAENVLRSTAFDPGAMQFRNETLDMSRPGKIVVCGEVNGKNRVGAYVGFRPFVYNGPTRDEAVLVNASDYAAWCADAR